MADDKLKSVEKAIIDQITQSIKVYVSQFKKTPNEELAKLIKDKCKEMEIKIDIYVKNAKRNNIKNMKINGMYNKSPIKLKT